MTFIHRDRNKNQWAIAVSQYKTIVIKAIVVIDSVDCIPSTVLRTDWSIKTRENLTLNITRHKLMSEDVLRIR